MRLLLVLCFLATPLAWFTSSYAANDQNCIPVPTKKEGDDIILLVNPPPKTSVIYFFNNHGDKSMFVDHPSSGRGVGAGWSSYLRPDHWSALSLNKSNFTIHCSTIEPGKVISLDCSKVLTVCTPKNPSLTTPLKGNFWLTEDKKWEAFLKAVEGRGVKLTQPETSKKDN